MAERRSSQPPEAVAADGSAIPARLRIVGWTVLATSLGLLAVGPTIRSSLLSDVEESANSNVTQEVDEFRTFAARGRDPETGAAFTSAGRLLQLYMERQFPGPGEFLVGYDRQAEIDGASPILVQRVEDPYGLLADPGLIDELVDGEARSGVAQVEDRPFRWGKTEIQAADGSAGGVFVVAEFLGPARAEVAHVVRVVALVCLGGLLLTAGIAFVVAGQILAPVRTVRRAAARITRADLSQRIEVRGRDDVAGLALTFNAMLGRLQSAFLAQQRFAHTAGRHLRAPLAVLSDESASSGDRRAALDEVASTLDDLEVLAASEAPGFVEPAPRDLRALTDELLSDARAITQRVWEVEEVAAGTAVLDAGRVRAAMRCLAHNAAAQPGDDLPLRLGSRVDDAHVELWVSDDGPGLAPEQAARMLDRYQDLEEPTGSPSPPAGPAPPAGDDGTGPGLGLAVVRAVADAHFGSAWVETEPGHGATFGLRLPLEQPHHREGASPADDDAAPSEASTEPAGGRLPQTVSR